MKRIVWIFVFLFFSCHSDGKSPFYFPSEDVGESPQIQFFYGSLGFPHEVKNSQSILSYESGVLCLFSLPLKLYKLELGGKFQICLRMDEKSFFRWKEGFSYLEKLEGEYPHFFESGKDWKVRLTEFGKWKAETSKTNPSLEWKQQIWSNGMVSYQVFAVPHPIFLQNSKTECEVVFRSNLLSLSENKSPAIVLTLPCPDTDSILESIQNQNEIWLSECTPNSPIVSEVFRHSESSYLRYLEWENPSDSILCPKAESIEWEEAGELSRFQSDEFLKRIRLVLPHGILLLSDEGKLQGIPIPKSFLLSLGTNSSIRFGDSSFHDSPFSFRQGDEFFSHQTRFTSCRDQWKYWKTKEDFCGNPGIPNEQLYDESMFSTPSCSLEGIHFTEFYPGNQADSQYPFPAFFEFQNRGPRCDLSSLNWRLNGSLYPFVAKETILEKDALFLFVRKPWTGWGNLEREKPFSLPKVVLQIPSFQLESRITKETKLYEFPTKEFHLIRSGEKNLHSIYRNQFEFPHPKQGSNQTLRSLGFYMSPGTHEDVVVPKVGGQLLELAINQYPFFDFGFYSHEEGIFSFQTSANDQLLFWKPKDTEIVSFAVSPNLCIGEKITHLPDGFFSSSFQSLQYKDKDKVETVLLHWEENSLNLISNFGIHSLHPEDSPIFFSSSYAPSNTCSGFYRTPGKDKHRSLEIRKSEQEGKYDTNFAIDQNTNVNWGNGRGVSNLRVTNVNPKFFQIDFGSFVTVEPSEQIYSFIENPKLIRPTGFLERKGPVQIEAIYPNPYDSQNEWVYVCNRSNQAEDLLFYSIEDETSSDPLVPYQTRFPDQLPKGKQGNGFVTNHSLLLPEHCAWIVDPDGKDWYLPIFHRDRDLLLTVKTTQTIGNGISSGESIQLRKEKNGIFYLVSSFGHRESVKPFRKTVLTGEYLWLKQNTNGTSADDFETFREEN
ncbi:LIC11755 family lipoprotein [Leptospira jelokensis]|uniref:LIC11755 family lipoprotein n=1 Tax=Leptospira jelokensis TaxID=2484931 RepID=UPI0010913289|nr:hypothetical protein [Leptospira jelokensis]TGL99156.1 hypothetical protein EHQ79_15165 [Leptospira jelokensis]